MASVTKRRARPSLGFATRISRRLHDLRKRAARRLFSVAAAGSAVNCVLCGWTGSRFFTRGRCPRCSSRARTRLVPYSLQRFGLDTTGKTLLHLGPNEMEVAWIQKHMRPRLHLVADIVPKRLSTITCDASILPFRDESVDIAIAWHVLEHILDDRGVMRDIERVLKPDGQVLMSVPIFPPGRTATFEDNRVPRERYLEVHGHRDHCRSPGLDYGERFVNRRFSMATLAINELASLGDGRDVARFGLSSSHVVWRFWKT